VTLTTHPLLVPWSWKARAIPLLPLWAVRPVQSLSACTRVTFTCTAYVERERAQIVETYNKNFWETMEVCKCYDIHLRVGRQFNSGFSVCYMNLHSVSLKQAIRVEERKRCISAMHCHLDITPNHPQLPLHPFTKI